MQQTVRCHAINISDNCGISRYMRLMHSSEIKGETMLTLLLSHPATAAAASFSALTDRFYGLFAAVQQAHATAARFESLAHLSDMELARRGLKREGLAQAVFGTDADTQA
jgi:hypothetical protein